MSSVGQNSKAVHRSKSMDEMNELYEQILDDADGDEEEEQYEERLDALKDARMFHRRASASRASIDVTDIALPLDRSGNRISKQDVKEWFAEKQKELVDRDKTTEAITSLGFGGFIYFTHQMGDAWLDKLLAPLAELAGIAENIIHSVGHGACVGLGFILSFVVEWVLLWIQKERQEFDAKDARNNERVYWDLVKRSFWSNFGAFLGCTGVAIAIALLCAALPCVVAIGIAVVVGMLIKNGIKWFWNYHRRQLYTALSTLQLLAVHKAFSLENLKEHYNGLRSFAERNIRDRRKREKRVAELKAARKILTVYVTKRSEDNAFLAAKVEAYIQNQEKASCLIM